MYFAQLDGEITNKQSQELLDKEYKKAIELENKNKEKIRKIASFLHR